MMASGTKRSWKLQDFVAHSATVNCLALGHKSGRVMVTGGDDKKVNLWAVGKESCFMSLSGHTTPVECVQFNHVEELVCAGSRAGALKVWDLEAAKLVRTLNGHKYSIRCVDFHPYGDLLVSGSADSSIKIWDSRKKGCIYTYNGHKSTVNSIKFSPDGQWIASGGEDTTVKIWDLRVGRVLKEFTEHVNSVNSVEFHPRDFLLASGGSDRVVHVYDLESFNVVSAERDLGCVRCLWFNPEGDCLFAGVRDCLKVVGWEPNRLFDSVPVSWGKICDISTAQNQLIGASCHLTNVMIHVVDLKKVQPLGNYSCDAPSPFAPNQSIRKSFSKAERPVSLKSPTSVEAKIIEESTSGTDPEEDTSADITVLKDYTEIFRGRDLPRTPPNEPVPFPEPEPQYLDPAEPQILVDVKPETFEALSLDHITCYNPPPPPTPATVAPPPAPPTSVLNSRSKSNLDQVYYSHLVKQQQQQQQQQERGESMILPPAEIEKPTPKQQKVQKLHLQRQNSCKDAVPEKISKSTNTNSIRHSVSEANISKTGGFSRVSSRKNSFSRGGGAFSSSVGGGLQKVVQQQQQQTPRTSIPVKTVPPGATSTPIVDIYVSPKFSPETPPEEEGGFVPALPDEAYGLNINDFLPRKSQLIGGHQQRLSMSEGEVLGIIMRGHEAMIDLLSARHKTHKLVFAQYRSKGAKSAMETAVCLDDLPILVDILEIFNKKYTIWDLDMCVLMLPKVLELLQSKYETYVTAGCNTLKLILKLFGSVIRTNVASPVGSFGVDISREERYDKCVKCHEHLIDIRDFLVKKESTTGTVGNSFKEISNLLQLTFDW